MKQLSGIEDFLLRVEDAAMPMHVSSLTIYDPSTAPGGKVGFKDIMRFFNERCYRNKVFRSRLVRAPLGIGSCYWTDDPHFDIEFHLRHIALPKPGDWRQLCIQVARLHARPLDHNHPLWECYVIEGIDTIPGLPAGCFALFLKTHYAALGGGLGTQLLAALHELAPHGRASLPKEIKSLGRLPTSADMLLAAAADTVRWPLKAATYFSTYLAPLQLYTTGKIGDWLRRPLRLLLGDANGHERAAPKTLFNDEISPHRVFEGVTFELNQITAMRDKVHNATVNDILICVIAGALRRYLHDKNALPAASLLAEAPITSRSEMKIDSMRHLADSAIMPLHTHIGDPLARLLAIVEETRNNKKNFQSFLGKRLLIDATDLVPTVLIKAFGEITRRTKLSKRLPPIFNTTISSIRGPDLPLYMTGARLVGSYGMDAIYDLAGLSHLIYYAAGTATISITSCRKMMPDPSRYAQCLQLAFAELETALLSLPLEPVPEKTKPKRRAAADRTKVSRPPKTRAKGNASRTLN